jgi:Family of unknown function (DUF6188)
VVTRVCVDYAFSLVVVPDEPGTSDSAIVKVESQFVYREPSGEVHRVKPGPPQVEVRPALGLHNQRITSFRVSADGELELEFDDGSALFAAPDPQYEAWTVEGPVQLVSMPGGAVAEFRQP